MGAKQLPATKITANTSTADEEVGRVRWESNGKAYRFILVEDANLATGDVVEYSDTSGYEVTNDRSGGSSVGRVVAGVAITAVTDAQYGWVQVSGRHASVKTDGGVSAGEGLVPHATSDGRADTAVSTTAMQTFGQALENDDGTTSAGTCAAAIRLL